MVFWTVLAAFLGMSFAAEACGLFAHEFNAIAAVAGLSVSAAFDGLGRHPSDSSRIGGRVRALAGWGLALVGLAFLPAHPAVRFFGIALSFTGLAAAAAARGRTESPMSGLAAASLLFGLFEYAAGTSLLTWYEVQGLSLWLTRPDLGPSFSGIHVAVLALAVVFSAWWRSGPRSRPALAGGVAAIAAAFLAWLAFWADCPSLLPVPAGRAAWGDGVARFLAALWPVRLPVLFPPLVGAVAAFCAWYFSRARVQDPAAEAGGRKKFVLAAAIAGLLGVWSLTNRSAPPRAERCRVVFYEKGFLNWMVPEHGNYGSYSSGMFGNLPKLIEAMEWEGALIPEIVPARLAGADVLVIINQDELFTRETLAAIREFVHGGGGLLLLGDHTCWKHGKVLVNEPLEAIGARTRIAFDSADFFVGGWLHSYQYFPHAATAALGDSGNEAGSVVGASLEVRYPAAPLVVGRYGYSDPGVLSNTERGYLGTLDFEPGEPLGDLPLVAAETAGKGRVVIAGDTSGFVNGILIHTHPFVTRVFRWLAGPGRASVPYWRDRLGVVLLAASGALALLASRGRPAAVPLVAAVLFVAGILARSAVADQKAPPFRGKVALVDDSRLGFHAMEGWRPDGIMGVPLHLMREGHFTIGMSTFDPAQVAEADVIVSVAPTRPYGEKEAQSVQSFLHKGGTYVLAAGWEERSAAEPFLARFGMGIGDVPLGRDYAILPDELGLKPHFWEAWPVRGGQTLAMIAGYPVVAEQRIGSGRLIVIGDSHFLTAKNLEGEEGVVMPNIQFLKRLIAPQPQAEGSR